MRLQTRSGGPFGPPLASYPNSGSVEDLGRSAEGIEQVVRAVVVHAVPEGIDADVLEGAEIGLAIDADKGVVGDAVGADIGDLLRARADGIEPDAVAVVIDGVEVDRV